jgi:hypothetical protein
MVTDSVASRILDQEARALLTRLARVKPFVLYETMVPAAALSLGAQTAVERYLANGRRELRGLVRRFLGWLHGAEGRRATPSEVQRRFTFIRLRFDTVLTQFDIFADVMTQRSEHDTGVWLAGLDIVAADAWTLPGDYYQPPAVVCYLDRGHGAAIRRARTRLPGGGENPVAVVRIPRERMVGSGIASSLVHEVGHQASALLDLVASLRPALQGLQRNGGREQMAWRLWERWLSEILADLWSVARVGVASTLGLIGVVSLPRAFVFRVSLDDPHPIPWIRVRLSCAMGQALFPHRQWEELAVLWASFYPLAGLDEDRRRLLSVLEATMPGFVTLLINHRPKALRGASLFEALAVEQRQPDRLAAYWRSWRRLPVHMRRAPPALVFAVLGQARADGQIGPEEESNTLVNLLTYWALRSTLDMSEICAAVPVAQITAPVMPSTISVGGHHG